MFKVLVMALLALNLGDFDRQFMEAGSVQAFESCRDGLAGMLPQASSGKEKAEIYWRMSRVCYALGEISETRDDKRLHYGAGTRFGEDAMKADPNNPEGYVWHCANMGRDALTRSMASQLAIVGKTQSDLTTVIDKMGQVRHSAAWQTMSEFYWRHPLKSNDAAINYGRKAVQSIAKDELWLLTYTYVAALLIERNWSASQRAAARQDNAKKFAEPGQKASDRYAWFDGSPNLDGGLPWLKAPLESVSDKQEAKAMLEYAAAKYRALAKPFPMDQREYQKLQQMLRGL